MRFRPWMVAALVALGAVLAPSAAAQSGGTTVPGPGDPCPAVYPGDDAEQKPIARWMARGAALRDLPQELPVMAGLAESGLRNLRHPGGSFFGFFGMHKSLNAGAYRGFPKNPELQLRWFTDTAVAVRQRSIAESSNPLGAGPAALGEWIADVERPAPENRDGYRPYFDDADDLLPGSCRPADHSPDVQAPALRVRAARRQRDTITLKVRCPVEACVAAAQAEPRRRVRAAPAVAVEDGPVTLTLPARSARGARLAVTVTAVDESGNANRVPRRITLVR
ncbi:MAG TPA: hypothetical protein VES62_01385 [Thermoleophilaceae bacterium]|nr:hypothetical protein [Thermoleophilaceae bacterium]